MKLKKIFNIEYPKTLIFSKQVLDSDGINFVSSSASNNGVVGRVTTNPYIKKYPAGIITVPLKGSVLNAFVQPEDCYVAHQIAVLIPQRKMTDKEKIFYCLGIRQSKFKYSFGRQADKTLGEIDLPDKIPSWVYTSKVQDFSKIRDSISNKKLTLDIKAWKEIDIESLFDVQGSKTTPKKVLKKIGEGKYPYITTQSTNNGIEGFYNLYTDKGNILTIDSAVIGFCSYHQEDFTASDHVEKLIPYFKMNVFIAMFLTTILNNEQYKYNYGRKFNQVRIKKTVIKLPFKGNKPDWQFMEEYIKSLKYSKALN